MQTHWLTAAVAASLLVAEHSCHSMIQRASLGSRHQQYVHVRPHPASQTWQCLAVGPPSTAVGCAGGRVCGLCRGAGSVAVWGAGSVGCAGGPGLWAVRGARSVGCAGGPGLWPVQGGRVCGLCRGAGYMGCVCGLCRGAGSVVCAGGPGDMELLLVGVISVAISGERKRINRSDFECHNWNGVMGSSLRPG